MEQTNTLDIKYLVTIDNTGMPKAPTLEQLLDKDVRLLYTRDTTKDKEMYLKEVGVIYYLADPNAPTKQQGLSDAECIKRAIENYDLPDNYQPDLLVFKIARRYHDQKITEAGIILENILKAIHNANIAVNILNESLNEKLHSDGITEKLRSQFVGTCLLCLKNESLSVSFRVFTRFVRLRP